ncbi:MAG: MBL fold metallo-hydrolase [Bryobacterales bacterium]|nr:MBL fold metallo-hydrolase [Bryobacterales bacterium]
MAVKPLLFAALLACSLPAFGARNLEIFFVDVEGGQATLLVTPAGESLLVDTGWPGSNNRDANRIAAAAAKAGVKQIDYLIITHFHTDHVGGIEQLAAKMPIKHVVDHGATVETGANAETLYKSYENVAAKAKRITVKPGDKLPLKGLQVEILAARGVPTTRPGKPNPLCSGVSHKAEDKSENARSVGTLITYGKFRFLDMGDLTWNKELELVCPENRIGKVDVYLTTHHGLDISNAPALVHAIAPRVAIMNNGETKGGVPGAWKAVKSSPGLTDLWQLHYSAAGGSDANTDEKMIANPKGQEAGNYIEIQAQSNGKFTVTNSRNGFSKSY